jgi:peptidyl-prolyl cis-trans isomerase B (cyclophilin B)
MQVRLNTSSGAIVLKLNTEKAPKTVANFISYVKSGFYTDTIFHRVINNFMIQGGGLDAGMRQKTGNAPIENEAGNGLKNTLGSVAMARTSEPHSASSQFFINVKNNDFLNYSSPTPQGWGYCVFGEVVEGMDVINAIKVVPTTNRAGHQDVPVEEIKILSAEVIEEA